MTIDHIHINCDMGESFGRYTLVDDAVLMPYINACNIACGYHAGDSIVMDRTIKLALEAGIQIGAHPSYPDRQGFGRRPMDIQEDELESLIRIQLCTLIGMTNSHGGQVTHVKAHGALYNKAANHALEATAIVRAVKNVSDKLILFAPYDSIQSKIAIDNGIKVFHEAFIDRRYNTDKSLVSRNLKNAIISDPKDAWNQVKSIHKDQIIHTIHNERVPLKADTYCIHGDNPAALSILEFMHREKHK